MSWTAIVPLKTTGERKSRLAAQLSAEERTALSLRMFRHVVGVLQGHPAIGRIIILANARPHGWGGDWIADQGRGLNAELEAVRATTDGDLLILHADLPLLSADDVQALLKEAEVHGLAMAPDRHGTGTNGLALKRGAAIEFCFGPDSFRLHRKQNSDCAVIRRDGFGLDLDTPDDLSALEAAGWR